MIKRSDRVDWNDQTYIDFSLDLIDASLAMMGAELVVVGYRYSFLNLCGEVYDSYESRDMMNEVCSGGLCPARSAWKRDMGKALAFILKEFGLPNGRMARIEIPIYSNEPSLPREDRRTLAKDWVIRTLKTPANILP